MRDHKSERLKKLKKITFKTVMVNNSTNINKTNKQLSL